MKKIMLTPMELWLLTCCILLGLAGGYAAHECGRHSKEAQFWQHQFTNSVIILKK